VSASIDQKAEGLSLSLLEGMAAGLPVVASNISGNQDLVQHGQTGFLFPPGDHAKLADALTTLLCSKELCDPMRTRAAKLAREYDWPEVARQYLNVYEAARALARTKG